MIIQYLSECGYQFSAGRPSSDLQHLAAARRLLFCSDETATATATIRRSLGVVWATVGYRPYHNEAIFNICNKGPAHTQTHKAADDDDSNDNRKK